MADRQGRSRRPILDVDSLQRHVGGEDRRQSATPEDPGHLRSNDLEVLQSIHHLGPLGRYASFRHRSSIGRLVREGFLTLDGVLDTAGEGFMEPVANAEDVLALRGQCGHERTLMQSWLFGDQVSTVSGASGADVMAGVVNDHQSRYTVALAEREALPSQACAWAGVRTAASVLTGEVLVSEDEFTVRVADSLKPPPPGMATRLADLWREPWFVWEVTSSRLGVNLAFINAQGIGNYVFGADAEASEKAGQLMVRIAPVTARAVWETMWVLSHDGGAAGGAGGEVLGVPQTGSHQLPPPDMPASH
ncbi:hypothetical protein [Citricoccus sp. GCM10030269]|uniref:hypothetical protein n=1 Tax=Citricoccus sp. GCM10030269 TaxID=3273388 RepID=UPI0036104867